MKAGEGKAEDNRLDLAPGEEDVLAEMQGSEGGRFILTDARVLYTGGANDSSLYASAQLGDVTAIEVSRRPRDRRSAWWGTLGLVAAVAVWQVTLPEVVGTIAGVVVGLLSLALLADYWLRPGGVSVIVHTPGGKVEGAVDGGRMADAEKFVKRLEQARREIKIGTAAGLPDAAPPQTRRSYPAI